HTNKVSTAAFSMDGQWLASAGHDRKVMIWSVQDKKTLYTLDGHTGNITSVDFAPDRPDTICSLDAEGELKVWNLKTSNCEKSLKMVSSGFAPNPMRFHPRTASVLACAVGNQINIIDITSSGKSNSGNSNNSSNHGKNICSFDWSPDGNFLVASSEDKICVYETSHWKCVMNHIPQSKISGCAFVNGGNEKLRLLYGGYQEIFLW
ncbi:hypothetical protein MUCCIDRAFT_122351, partial [Mucor lusitanicus CBS 277.49]